MIEKMKTNARTSTDIQAPLIDVKKNKITGIKRTRTAKKPTTSLAKQLIRSVEKYSTVSSWVRFSCFLVMRSFCAVWSATGRLEFEMHFHKKKLDQIPSETTWVGHQCDDE